MKNLKTVTQVFAGGKWLPAGSPLPGDLPNFDYEKHAAKGLIEDTEGDEIRNPGPQVEASELLELAESDELVTLRQQLADAQRERDAMTAAHRAVGEEVGKMRDSFTAETASLKADLQQAQEAAQALAEYREVIGELLPDGFPERRLLLDNGYYTAEIVQAASDEELLALDGIAEKKLEAVRKVAPHVAQE